jgi:hypothetical protein
MAKYQFAMPQTSEASIWYRPCPPRPIVVVNPIRVWNPPIRVWNAPIGVSHGPVFYRR